MRDFEELKWKLTSPLMLALHRRDDAITVETESFGLQIGDVLLKYQPATATKLIRYFSVTLIKCEQNCDTTRL